jgi:transcription-repair coupling factor (superfamily II helicase)
MNTREILGAFAQIQPMQTLAAAAEHAAAPIHLQGLAGSGFALAAASLYASTSRPIIAILPNKDEAQYFKSDLENLLVGESVYFLPDSFLKPYNLSRENAMGVQERIETLNALRKNPKRVFVTYTSALTEFVVDKAELEKSSIEIARGQSLDTDFLMEFLQVNGFERRDFVFEPGEFSVRGGIVDLFSFAHEFPFRIELDGDIIESIRTFDVNDQLSLKEIAHFSLLPNIQEQRNQETTISITDYFDPKTIVFAHDMQYQVEELAKACEKALQVHQEAVDFGREIIPKHPKQIWNTPKGFENVLKPFTQIHFSGSRPTGKVEIIEFYQQPQPLFKRNFPMLIDWMQQNHRDGFKTLVFSENSRQIERLTTILSDTRADVVFDPVYQGLSAGFVDRDVKIAFATEHQLFDKYYRPKGRQKYSSQTSLTLRELKNLKPGDFVTHIDHGIGRFAGLEKMDVHGVTQEVVRIVYKDNDLLYVSVNSLHKISKYTGKDGTPPSMHKLGSPQWDKQKKATKKKVKDIARELIALYAKRKGQQGFAFAPDNYLQMELEASFFYEDTPDQAKAVEDTKRDMELPQPMDRLVCGDVGFGKTEVAMRAAFKAVCDSKQVAVLVPTTILAQQHYRSFTKRFAGFPVTVDYINRFKSAKEQKATLDKVKAGKIDVLIGTHRILGKDIEFRDLGLMIIDEEQKFGVSAKEKLKERKVNVDSLTLTATPIPRTLHFSLMGARDLSVINTPPPNRQPVHTELHTFNKDLIAEAVTHELERGGQVFFVHSRVKDIHEIARLIGDAVPGCKVCVAHGQMEGHELEDVMVQFIEGEYDVLVATTIIESGLDIPNANTIIINNAHLFGLSDLHQMRGRVGRSNTKAFCYLLSPPVSVLSEDARKRLRTLEEYSELGSGFQVAMRDLDIRGAGNLLGGEQSGFISEMGFDMYHKILDEAVRELKHEEFEELFDQPEDISSRDCQVDTQFEMLIPSDYVTQTAERLALYSELSGINTELELQRFASNLKDRFGKLPQTVVALLDTVRLKWAGKQLGMEKISLGNGGMRCYFPGDPNATVYHSESFVAIMGFVASNPNKFSVKQTDKALIVTVKGLETVFEALHVLSEWDTHRTEIAR